MPPAHISRTDRDNTFSTIILVAPFSGSNLTAADAAAQACVLVFLPHGKVFLYYNLNKNIDTKQSQRLYLCICINTTKRWFI
jgi:hypothetical protein